MFELKLNHVHGHSQVLTVLVRGLTRGKTVNDLLIDALTGVQAGERLHGVGQHSVVLEQVVAHVAGLVKDLPEQVVTTLEIPVDLASTTAESPCAA